MQHSESEEILLGFEAAYLFCSELKIIVYIIGGWIGVTITHVSQKSRKIIRFRYISKN
jgi:hypothetical protein